MSIDLPPLYKEVINHLPTKPVHYTTPAVMIAVFLQESEGSPTFTPLDDLYKANMAAATKYTTLPELMLMDALLIKSGPLAKSIAKFRFEPSYWAWSGGHQLSSPTERFLASCSFGVGQQMMRWVLPPKTSDWLSYIENFKGNVDLQITTAIDKISDLMRVTNGDLFEAYKGYNSGNIKTADPAVIDRALNVVRLRDMVQKQLAGG